MVQFSPSSDYGAIPKADSVARQIDRSKSRTLVFEEKIDKNDLWPYKTAKPAKFYNQKENEISGEAYLPNYRPKQVCSVGQKLIFWWVFEITSKGHKSLQNVHGKKLLAFEQLLAITRGVRILVYSSTRVVGN